MSASQYFVVKTTDAKTGEGQTTIPISRTDGKKGKSGLCIVVPVVSDSVVTLVQNDEHGKQWIANHIDAVRSMIASKLNKAGEVITSDKLGITAILAAIKEDTENQRMTKESIGIWFDADLADAIGARVKELMTGISEDKVKAIVAGYKAQFQSLSARDVSMKDTVRDQMIRALELLGEDYESPIGTKVAAKLATVTEASEVLVAL